MRALCSSHEDDGCEPCARLAHPIYREATMGCNCIAKNVVTRTHTSLATLAFCGSMAVPGCLSMALPGVPWLSMHGSPWRPGSSWLAMVPEVAIPGSPAWLHQLLSLSSHESDVIVMAALW